MAGGCYRGQVSFWDERVGGRPQGMTEIEHSHKDRVNKAKWVNNKGCTEFFTGAGDGVVKWWDIRKFGTPIDSLVMAERGQGDTQILGDTLIMSLWKV